MTLQEIKDAYQQRKGKKTQIEQDIIILENEISEKKALGINLEKAHEIIKLVGLKTQQQLEFHISDITSLALESVFKDPYKIVLDFVDKRGKIECDISFEKDGNLMDPLDATGVGVVDVASFALRIAMWSMQKPRTRSTIILDEPFKHLSGDNMEAASQMMKQLSQRLGIQFIIITHSEVLATYADRIFSVKQRKKITKVKTR